MMTHTVRLQHFSWTAESLGTEKFELLSLSFSASSSSSSSSHGSELGCSEESGGFHPPASKYVLRPGSEPTFTSDIERHPQYSH